MANVDFDPFSREFFDDPFATYARMREEAPCFHSDRWDFYAFSRFADIVPCTSTPRTSPQPMV